MGTIVISLAEGFLNIFLFYWDDDALCPIGRTKKKVEWFCWSSGTNAEQVDHAGEIHIKQIK